MYVVIDDETKAIKQPFKNNMWILFRGLSHFEQIKLKPVSLYWTQQKFSF